MKALIRGAGVAAALVALSAGQAHAFGPFSNTQVCGGASFYTCVTLTTSYDATTNTLTLTVTNDGAYALGNVALGDVVPVSGTGATGYGALGAQNDLTGGQGNLSSATGYKADNTPSALGLGETGVFTFTFDNTFDDNIGALTLGMHFREGPENCGSSKLWIDPNNGATGPTGGVYAAGCGPTTTVPEPITMTLLATGLAGMGGAGIVRRRKQA